MQRGDFETAHHSNTALHGTTGSLSVAARISPATMCSCSVAMGKVLIAWNSFKKFRGGDGRLCTTPLASLGKFAHRQSHLWTRNGLLLGHQSCLKMPLPGEQLIYLTPLVYNSEDLESDGQSLMTAFSDVPVLPTVYICDSSCPEPSGLRLWVRSKRQWQVEDTKGMIGQSWSPLARPTVLPEIMALVDREAASSSCVRKGSDDVYLVQRSRPVDRGQKHVQTQDCSATHRN